MSSGESELPAVVRAAGMGLQSVLSDFGLCGHVAIKSDATAAVGMVHRPGLGKIRHFAVGAQTKYFGPEPLLRHTKACN